MRLFDVIGVLSVAAWLTVVGLYAHERLGGGSASTHNLSSQVLMTEGESWMVLRRDDTAVGFIHEVRTQLADGWLLEYQMLMNIAMMGLDQRIETTIKASVNNDAILRTFSAEIGAMGQTFRALGEASDTHINLTTYAAGSSSKKRIELKEPPRLAASALNQVLASPDLKPGAIIRQEFFDPSSMGMTEMTIEYVGPTETTVYDQAYSAHQFRQRVAGTSLNVVTDDQGNVLIQAFPLGIVGSRVPAELGRAQAMSMRRQAKERDQKKGGEAKGVDFSLDAALNLLANTTRGSESEAPPKVVGQYVISGIDDAMGLVLESGRQRLVSRDGERAVITMMPEADAFAPDVIPDPELVAMTARVDGDASNITALLEGIDAEDTPSERAKAAAKAVRGALKPAPNIAVLAASQALELGSGDCTEYALITVAALRSLGIATRFVHGVIDEGDRMTPHQWVQYFDGKQFVDLDATRADLSVSRKHIQFFTSAEPEHPSFVHVLGRLKIE
ncbi:MAG: transglutaminase domain-containing protein [Bradymonadaceae bacterium]|nr:transglutaminase domain-containing protein [Lujinxingiaceae bacterium]